MTLDFDLFFAFALIGVAGSLALLAYAVVLIRRKKERAVEVADDELTRADAAEAVDDQPEQEDASMDEEKTVEDASTTDEGTATAKDDALFNAELLRNKDTGTLIVTIDEQRYSKASDIKDPATLGRLEDAAAALVHWLATADSLEPSPEEAVKDKSGEPIVKPKTMIEEINEILEQRSEEGKAPLGLRLFEGPEGTVRVYVGVDSYEVDEVPDKKIRGVIKKAVAEWEARQ